MYTAILGAVQAGLGIWQAIKSSQEKAPIDKMKPPSVSNELYQSKSMVKNLYSDVGAERQLMENQAADRAAQRRMINAGVNLSPAGRLQADIASSVESGIDKSSIYRDYRKAFNDVVSMEMEINKDISNAKLDVYNQNLELTTEKQDLYNKRQAAWGELINAGISNVAGALQSRSNDFMMNRTSNQEEGLRLKEAASKYIQPSGLVTEKDMNRLEQDMKRVDRLITSGNYDAASRIINKYKY